jgi:hypothetical protein
MSPSRTFICDRWRPQKPGDCPNGNTEKAIEIVLDLEQLIYEVNTLLNAASMINRISKT